MPRYLPPARLVWLLVAALALGLAAVSLPDYLREAGAVAPADQRTFSQLSPAEYQLIQGWGLSAAAYAAYVIAWSLSPLLVYVIVASIIFQRSPDWGVAFWMSLMLVAIGGAMPFLGGITEFRPALQPVVNVTRALGAALLVCLFFVFPDGRFIPRWTGLVALLWAAWMVLWIFSPGATWGLVDAAGTFTPVGLLAMVVGVGAGVLAQLYRFRHVSTALQRQQGKVFAFGFSAFFVTYLAGVAPYFLFPGVRAPGWPYLVYGLAWVPLLTRAAFMLIPLTIGFAVLRYRLWDIDLIIRRTLIYGVMTGILALTYAGMVIVLQPVFTLLTGQQQSELSTVLSTLSTAALFGPVRGAVQGAIDRRFYRRKYDANQAFETFSSRMAEVVEVERLSDHLLAVVEDTLQPAHVSLWLRVGGQRREDDDPFKR